VSKAAVFDLTDGNKGNLRVFDLPSGVLSYEAAFDLDSVNRVFITQMPLDIDKTIVSLPVSEFDLRVIELPLSGIDALRDVLPFELDGAILAPVDSLVIEAVILNEHPESSEVLAVYIDKVKLQDVLNKMEGIGINPSVVSSLELRHLVDRASANEPVSDSIKSVSALEDKDREALSQREADAPVINFRRDAFAYRRSFKGVLRSMILASALLLLVLALIIGDMSLKASAYTKEANAQSESLHALYKAMMPDLDNMQGMSYKVASKLEELRAKDKFMQGVAPLEFFMKLQQKYSSGISVTDITMARGRVQIKGEADSAAAVQEYRVQLGEFLGDVKVSQTGASVSGKTSFTIEARQGAR
jgi:type II secretory pathway component PulL